MVLGVAFFFQNYSRLLGTCTFALSAWLLDAYVAAPFLRGRVWCEERDREKGDRAWWERGDQAVAAAMATTQVGSGERGGEM